MNPTDWDQVARDEQLPKLREPNLPEVIEALRDLDLVEIDANDFCDLWSHRCLVKAIELLEGLKAT